MKGASLIKFIITTFTSIVIVFITLRDSQW